VGRHIRLTTYFLPSATQNGGYTVTGALEVQARPEDVYAVLVDYEGAHNIFSNIEATKVLEVDGKTQLLQVQQSLPHQLTHC
jgi:aspartate 1-decarboxylase